MTQTIMNTRLFQVIITITIGLGVMGIIASIYNIIQYRRMNINNKQHVQSVSIITVIIFTFALSIIIAILALNFNWKNTESGIIKPEIGTAKNLADLFSS